MSVHKKSLLGAQLFYLIVNKLRASLSGLDGYAVLLAVDGGLALLLKIADIIFTSRRTTKQKNASRPRVPLLCLLKPEHMADTPHWFFGARFDA